MARCTGKHKGELLFCTSSTHARVTLVPLTDDLLHASKSNTRCVVCVASEAYSPCNTSRCSDCRSIQASRDSVACFTAVDAHRVFNTVPVVAGHPTPTLGAAARLPARFDVGRPRFITVAVIGSGSGRAHKGIVLVRCYVADGQPRPSPESALTQPTVIQTMPHPPGRPVCAVGNRSGGRRHLLLGWRTSATVPARFVCLTFARVDTGVARGGDMVTGARTLPGELPPDVRQCCVVPSRSHEPDLVIAALSKSGHVSLLQVMHDASHGLTAATITSLELGSQQVRSLRDGRRCHVAVQRSCVIRLWQVMCSGLDVCCLGDSTRLLVTVAHHTVTGRRWLCFASVAGTSTAGADDTLVTTPTTLADGVPKGPVHLRFTSVSARPHPGTWHQVRALLRLHALGSSFTLWRWRMVSCVFAPGTAYAVPGPCFASEREGVTSTSPPQTRSGFTAVWESELWHRGPTCRGGEQIHACGLVPPASRCYALACCR